MAAYRISPARSVRAINEKGEEIMILAGQPVPGWVSKEQIEQWKLGGFVVAFDGEDLKSDPGEPIVSHGIFRLDPKELEKLSDDALAIRIAEIVRRYDLDAEIPESREGRLALLSRDFKAS